MTTTVAVILLVAVTAYVLLGGADFGAGMWDLTAGGADRGARPRALIEQGIGPVWEANHVWLIFVFVITWTAFPEAYEAITLTMFVPLTIAALGIVARGAGFAFRKAVVRTRYRRFFGAVFASSSVLVPYCWGAIAGGILSGQVPAGGRAGDPVHSWINPTSIVVGLLGVAAVAHLAATYLVWVAHRARDHELAEYFRRRALASGVLAVALAVVGAFMLSAHASYVFDGLTSRGLVPTVIAALASGGTLVLLALHVLRGLRALAALAVGGIVIAGGAAQWPYILPTSLTFSAAAAPKDTLVTILVVTVLAALIVLPGFALLFVLDQRDLLHEDEESAGPPLAEVRAPGRASKPTT